MNRTRYARSSACLESIRFLSSYPWLLLAVLLQLVYEPPILVRFDTGVPESEARLVAGELKKALAEARERYSSRPVSHLEVRLHATTVGFAEQASAPWWHAAEMRRNILHFQPVSTLTERGILRRVIRHEAAHVALRTRGGPPFPHWLEEGEAMRFSSEPEARSRDDLLPTLGEVARGLEHPRSRDESRRAYLSAAAFVRWLGPWISIDPKADFDRLYRDFLVEFTAVHR